MEKIQKYHLNKLFEECSSRGEKPLLDKFKDLAKLNKDEETLFFFEKIYKKSPSVAAIEALKEIMGQCLVEKNFDLLDNFWTIFENERPAIKSHLKQKLATLGDSSAYEYLIDKNIHFEEHYVATALKYKNYELLDYIIEDKEIHKGKESSIFLSALQNKYMPLMEKLYVFLEPVNLTYKKEIFTTVSKLNSEDKNIIISWLLDHEFDFSQFFDKNEKNNITMLINDISQKNIIKLFKQADEKDMLGAYVHLHMQQHSPNEKIIEAFFTVCETSEKVMKSLSQSQGYEKFFHMLSSLVLKEKLETNLILPEVHASTKSMKI